MATLSHPAFRVIIEKFGGCDEYYTEMIHAPSLLHGGQFEKYYINPAPVPQKIVWQLTGKTAESIAEAAKLIAPLGGIGIDLNMGCCAPEIVRSGAGIAWMQKPQSETAALVRAVKRVLEEYEAETGIHRRLSVKCRLGDEDFTDEQFFGFAGMLAQNGAEQIAVHPRTKKEKYREKPRWHYAQELAQMLSGNKDERTNGTPLESGTEVSVIVNGDVHDAQSFCAVRNACPACAGIMIGRAAVQKPWIFAELQKHAAHRQTAQENSADEQTERTPVDLLQLAMDFISAVEAYQPPEFYKTRLQRFFAYFCDNLSFAHYAKTRLLNAKTPDESRTQLTEYFEKVPLDRFRISF